MLLRAKGYYYGDDPRRSRASQSSINTSFGGGGARRGWGGGTVHLRWFPPLNGWRPGDGLGTATLYIRSALSKPQPLARSVAELGFRA